MGIIERKVCDNMRAIDADAVPQEFWEYEFDGKWRGCTIKDLLDSQPTIQPEIVRCKDCEHGVLDDGFPHQYFCIFKGDEWNNADYFCGHAKRREVTT